MSDANDAELGSREKILKAAVQMLGEDAGARLSVRAVAAKAGVSTGSLRFHFPTQDALRHAVLSTIYDFVVSDAELIHDTSKPPRERLLGCLRQILAPMGTEEEARTAWAKVFDAFVAKAPDDRAHASYRDMEAEGQRRVEFWLSTLAAEGALAAEDVVRRARFLSTVVNGLSIERALPSTESLLRSETETLTFAVDAVLRG